MENIIRYSAPATAFTLPPELLYLKDLVREIVDRECIPLESAYLAADSMRHEEPADGADLPAPEQGALDAQTWARLEKISRDAGIYDVHLPVAAGGGGFGVLGWFVVEEEMFRSVVPLPVARVPGILYDCSDYQRERYLMPTVRGEKHYAFAQTEPDAGSDPGNSMRTKATRDGDEWLINGTKTFISYARHASYMLLQAVTDESLRQRGGITMFIIDMDTPGIEVTPVPLWFPGPATQYMIHLTDVRVPSANVLGEVGGGFRLGQQWLAIQDRLHRGSMACGILSRSLEMAVEWTQNRSTFGQPLSERQAIQWMMVDVFTDLKAIRAISYECAVLADQGYDVRAYAALAKLMGGNWGHRSIDKVMQMFGGMGESLELPISHWYRQLRHARIGGGADEIQRMLIARQIFRQGKTLWQA